MKQTTILSLILLILLTGCRGQSNDNYSVPTPSNQTTNTSFVPTDSTQFYFPLEVFRDTSIYVGHDTFVDTWYSQHLFAMREPVIFMDKSQNEIYRFTWLRTFHNPVAIRIEKHGDTCLLYWKLCNGAGGYAPGTLTIDKHKIIDKQTWEAFKNKLNGIDFWNLVTNEKEMSGTDGSQWILEGKTSKQYHVVDRWSPSDEQQYYQCCDFLIALTDLKIKDHDKY